jgi:hypothetical protein
VLVRYSHCRLAVLEINHTLKELYLTGNNLGPEVGMFLLVYRVVMFSPTSQHDILWCWLCAQTFGVFRA